MKRPTPLPQAVRADQRAIRRLAADWREGWLRGDADALIALYADHPVLMPQGQPAIIGKAAIRRVYRSVFDAVAIKSRSQLREVVVSGGWGYFWSTYSLVATPKGGGAPTKSQGKSLFIVKRQRHGGWRIARLIDNSDWPG